MWPLHYASSTNIKYIFDNVLLSELLLDKRYEIGIYLILADEHSNCLHPDR